MLVGARVIERLTLDVARDTKRLARALAQKPDKQPAMVIATRVATLETTHLEREMDTRLSRAGHE